ncbi:topoisomerase DNA-binding C4 zinc finger domain-containing protein [Bacillaceae bacterium W0354]
MYNLIYRKLYNLVYQSQKHYEGWIFGKENQRYWTQVIYKRKEKFLNPIWQNYGHIQALKNYLGKEDLEFHSIIAFSQNSTFKFKEDFKSARVIQFPQLAKVIQELDNQKISIAELKEINQTLEGLVIKDKKEKKRVKQEHVQALKSKRTEKVRKEKGSLQQYTCPKCGGKLSLKKGKYGTFYGCSNFPKCRFTKKAP